ncbi:MAG: cache domain-containing protein, partial [Oscillospiraceae bacterium]|nr:cache domain-containing protein [Oscillospiraceae bacterium]
MGVQNGIKPKTGFAKKIMLMSAIPVTIIGVILAVYSTIQSYVILSSKFAEEVLALSASYGTAVENRISRLEESFNIVIMDPDVVSESLSMDERKAILEKAAGMTMLNDFSISYADGTTYNNTDISAREYFQHSMKNKSNYISSPVVRLTDNSITIMMGQYFSCDGTDYLAYGGMNIDVFNDVIHDVDNGEGSVCFIIDKNGQIISTSSEDKLPLLTELSVMDTNQKFGSLAGLLDRFMSGERGTTKGMLDGREYIYGYVPISSDEGWTIIVGTPTDSITSNIVRTAIISAAILIVCVLIIIPIITGMVKKICAPITESSNRLRLFAQGNVSAPAPKCSTNDEIQQMTESMGDMITTIGGYIRDIHFVLSA